MREVTWRDIEGSVFPDWFPFNLRLGKNVCISPSVTFIFESSEDTIEIGNDSIIRSGAVIYHGSKLGKKVAIGHNTILRENTVIGDHTYLGGSVVCEGNASVGSHCGINAQCHLTKFLLVGNYVFFGAGVTTANDKPMKFRREGHGVDLKAPIIHDGVRMGNQAYIGSSVEIGERAVVGSGAVVMKSVPKLAIVVGVPAKVTRIKSPEEEPIIPCKECV